MLIPADSVISTRCSSDSSHHTRKPLAACVCRLVSPVTGLNVSLRIPARRSLLKQVLSRRLSEEDPAPLNSLVTLFPMEFPMT